MRPKLTLAVLPLVALLTACAANSPPEVRVEYVKPPAALMTCPEAPEVPETGASDNEIGEYILRLWGAHRSCYDSLEAVRSFVQER